MNSADIAAMFVCADGAVRARLNGSREINVLFDSDVSIVLGVDTHAPAVSCRAADGLRAGDVLVVNGDMFKVVSRLSGDDEVETWQVQTV